MHELSGFRSLVRGASERRLFNQIIAHRQNVHPGTKETVDGLFRGQDDRLVLVEGGIEEHRHAGQLFEFLDQRPVPRVGLAAHRLKTSSSIDMRRGRNGGPLFRAHRVRKIHERRGVGTLEVFARWPLPVWKERKDEKFPGA